MRAVVRDSRGVLFCAWGLWVGMAAEARDKTDIVTFQNGDRLSGEIIRLDHGVLEVKTNAMGTVYVDWPKIRSLSSPIKFVVENLHGEKHYGALTDSAAGLGIEEGGRVAHLPLLEVASLDPVRDSFLGRVRGTASVGVNYSRAAALSATSFRFTAEYQGLRTLASLSTAADVTTSKGNNTNQRLTVDFSERFFLAGTRFWSALTSFERIQQLGVNGRLQAGLALGQSLYRTPDQDLLAYGGVAASEEQVKNTGATDHSLEGVLGLDWRVYKFADDKTTLNASLVFYPGLTDGGRVRGRLNLDLSRKLSSSLTLTLSVYDDYDNRPPGEPAVTNDYGIVTGLGYTF